MLNQVIVEHNIAKQLVMIRIYRKQGWIHARIKQLETRPYTRAEVACGWAGAVVIKSYPSIWAGAVMQKRPVTPKKQSVTDRPTDRPTDRRTEWVIESRARD